jgi:competence protein ComEA
VRRREFATEALFLATVVALVVGIYSLVPHLRHERFSQVVISPPGTTASSQLMLHVSGPGTFEGAYAIDASMTLGELLRIVLVEQGEVPPDLCLVVAAGGESDESQRIDINRADVWLLEALPGIGAGKAQAIVDFRELHGPFACTEELALVPGIGAATYEVLRGLVTVSS